MIQEYRKASAKKLEIKMDSDGSYFDPTAIDFISIWQPDKDANQREMIEDWFTEQGYGIDYEIFDTRCWVAIHRLKNEIFEYEDKSRSTAFMKAFMDYIEHGKYPNQ